MIGVHHRGETVWLEPEELARWVEDGRIAPDTPVRMRDSEWIRADALPGFAGLARPPQPAAAPPGGRNELARVLFPRRGLSATEGLLLVNILVAAVLLVLWGGDYLVTLRGHTADWWHEVHDRNRYGYWLVTIFLHAGPRHLLMNMVSLLGTAGAVEFLMGARWTLVLYVFTGVCGMVLSYLGHDRPTLSVGASGAIFGLAGATLTFLLRRHRSFTYRQRWKARRVYGPLFIVLFLPSLLHADYLGHLGGLIGGLLVGALIPPHRRVRELAARDSMASPEPGPH